MYGQFDEVRIIKKIYEDYDLPKTCIEFGAYDGITNSNTYYFWNKKGFRSLLKSYYKRVDAFILCFDIMLAIHCCWLIRSFACQISG